MWVILRLLGRHVWCILWCTRPGRTGNQINEQRNPLEEEHKHKPDPLLQTSKVDQSANPGYKVRDRRQGNKNHSKSEQCLITKASYLGAVRVSIRARRSCASNETSNDHAYTNDIHNDAHYEEDADSPFSHEIPPIKEIILVIPLSVNDLHIAI